MNIYSWEISRKKFSDFEPIKDQSKRYYMYEAKRKKIETLKFGIYFLVKLFLEKYLRVITEKIFFCQE